MEEKLHGAASAKKRETCFSRSAPVYISEDTPFVEKSMAQHQGTVVWFNNSKGYGFLKTSSGTEVFCHYSAIQSDGYRSLSEGQHVEFDVEPGASGRNQATNVRIT